MGKGLTDKKRVSEYMVRVNTVGIGSFFMKTGRVGWKEWCLCGLALFMIMKLFTTNYVKNIIIICNVLL